MTFEFKKFLPITVFLVFAIVVWFGLARDPKYIPPAVIGKPVPAFELPQLQGVSVPGLQRKDLMQGKITLVNIWASWCVPCRQEHPQLLALAKRTDIALVGINNKDEPANALQFLQDMGNPYSAIGVDSKGRTTIDFGAYGVPETFLVDGNGIVRSKIIGELTAQYITEQLPRDIAQAQAAAP